VHLRGERTARGPSAGTTSDHEAAFSGEGEDVLNPATGVIAATLAVVFGRASCIVTDDIGPERRLAHARECGVVGAVTHHCEASLRGAEEFRTDIEGGIEILEPCPRIPHVGVA
jgi:hypothetical protein